MPDFNTKMHQNRFPDPAGGAYIAPPDPLAGFKGPTSKGRGREGEGKGNGGEGRGVDGWGEGGTGRDPPNFKTVVAPLRVSSNIAS